jgi:hypothetical protein
LAVHPAPLGLAAVKHSSSSCSSSRRGVD